MLEGLKRLFSGGATPQAGGWEGIAPWAASKQYGFRLVHDEGFVIDGRLGAAPWRLEWGPSHRPYIQGQELRIRAEMGLGSDLQLVLLNRPLQESMEKAVFDQYVEGVQTRIDNQTPPEMRWLVMYPKLSGADMPQLRERFVALSSIQGWLKHWLDGPVTQALAGLRIEPDTPLVIMIGRGRLMLRTQLPDVDVPALQAWVRLFETVMREARRVAEEDSDSIAPSTQPSLWSGSALPDDEGQKK